MEILLVGINSRHYQVSQSIRMLRKNSVPYSDILELNSNDTIIDQLTALTRKRYDIYAFSLYIWNYEDSCKIIRSLKSLSPDSFVIAGGPEIAVSNIQKIFKDTFCDALVVGEGERALKTIVENGCEIYPQMAGSGIYSRKLSYNDEFCKETYEQDLSRIKLLEAEDIKDRKLSFAYTETSRGCPFDCNYCLSGNNIPVRNHDIEKVKKNILSLANSDINTLRFIDRTFNINEKRAYEIMHFILEECPKILYQFEVRADIMTTGFIDFLSDVPKGRFQLEIGIQTLNRESLEKVERNEHENRLLNNLKRLTSKRNLQIHLDLIAGLPGDDVNSIYNTIDILACFIPDILQINLLKILPGTTMVDLTKEYDMIFEKHPPYTLLKSSTFSFQDIRYIDDLSRTINVFYNSGYLKNTFYYLFNVKKIDASKILRIICDFTLKEMGRIHSLSRRKVFKLLIDVLFSEKLLDEEIRKIIFLDHMITSKDAKERFDFFEEDQIKAKNIKSKVSKKRSLNDNTVLKLSRNLIRNRKSFPKKVNIYDKELIHEKENFYFYFSDKIGANTILYDEITIDILELIIEKKANSIAKVRESLKIDRDILIKHIQKMIDDGILI